MATVAEIMHKEVITVSPRSTLRDLARLLSEAEISGVPVVDNGGSVLGVVSATDVLRAASEEDEGLQRALDAVERRGSGYYRDLGRLLSDAELELLLGNGSELDDVMVREIMTTSLLAVEPELPIPEAARLMSDKHAHRVLVIDNEELVGIVTAFDMVKAIADGHV